jgi:hypothetical protein
MDNRQAMGYMLLVCKELNLDKETFKKIRGEVHHNFDVYTEEQTEEKGNLFDNMDLVNQKGNKYEKDNDL